MTILNNKTILITGANSGIGKAAAIELAKQGAHIIMLCRDKARGEKAHQEISESSKSQLIELEICDLSSLDDIRRWAASWLSKKQPLHILFNNAGIVVDRRLESIDGFEMMFATNHLGPFLLTHLLMDRLIESQASTIINTSSEAYKLGGALNFDDLQTTKDFAVFPVYGRSKLANIYFTQELAKRLARTNIKVNCFHPGAVRTELGDTNNLLLKALKHIVRLFFRSPAKGAETAIYLCSDQSAQSFNGEYFYNCQVKPLTEIGENEADAKRLWEISAQLTGLENHTLF